VPCIPAMREERKGASQQTQQWCPAERRFHWDGNMQGLVVINASLLSSVK